MHNQNTHNERVTHLYDRSCTGTLVRNNDNEALVGVVWDDRPNVVQACLREEICFPKAHVQTPKRRNKTERQRRFDTDSYDSSLDF